MLHAKRADDCFRQAYSYMGPLFIYFIFFNKRHRMIDLIAPSDSRAYSSDHVFFKILIHSS